MRAEGHIPAEGHILVEGHILEEGHVQVVVADNRLAARFGILELMKNIK